MSTPEEVEKQIFDSIKAAEAEGLKLITKKYRRFDGTFNVVACCALGAVCRDIPPGDSVLPAASLRLGVSGRNLYELASGWDGRTDEGEWYAMGRRLRSKFSSVDQTTEVS